MLLWQARFFFIFTLFPYLFFFMALMLAGDYRTCLMKHTCRELGENYFKFTYYSDYQGHIKDLLSSVWVPDVCRGLEVLLGGRGLAGRRLWVPISVLGKTNKPIKKPRWRPHQSSLGRVLQKFPTLHSTGDGFSFWITLSPSFCPDGVQDDHCSCTPTKPVKKANAFRVNQSYCIGGDARETKMNFWRICCGF